MENFGTQNKNDGKRVKMTLKGYYDSLPRVVSPKVLFINRICQRTGRTANGVRNWVVNGQKPRYESDIKVLSEETGIPAEELW